MSTGVRTAIGKFVWHENLSTDVETVKRFYTELFGWETEVWKPGEMDYAMIKANGQTHGGFGDAQGGSPPHWLGHVVVEDVDEAARRAEGAGGKILTGPIEMPEIGRFALIADPQGAVVSAYAPAGTGDEPVSEGVFVWDELMTNDIEGAKSFYREVFGWASADMDMGEMTYVVFKRDGDTDVAGGMNMPPGMVAPPHWRPYIGTSDVDGTVARAKKLGANILMEAMDVPNVGRMAIVQDPVGAVFGVFKPQSS